MYGHAVHTYADPPQGVPSVPRVPLPFAYVAATVSLLRHARICNVPPPPRLIIDHVDLQTSSAFLPPAPLPPSPQVSKHGDPVKTALVVPGVMLLNGGIFLSIFNGISKLMAAKVGGAAVTPRVWVSVGWARFAAAYGRLGACGLAPGYSGQGG